MPTTNRPTQAPTPEPYDIIVRFPTKKMADEFCGQMSDGFGEGLCDFSFWYQKPGSPDNKESSYSKVTIDLPHQPKTEVYFVNSIEEF